MSGTFPASPAPREVTLTSRTSTLVSFAQSMKRQARTRNAHRWMLRFAYPPMTRAQWAVLYAFLVKQRGRYETFQVVLPSPLILPQGSAPGSPLINNEAGSPTELQTGSRAVNTKGWTAGVTGVLKAGDFFKYTGHTKVYVAIEDASSDGSGLAVVSQEPALFEGPAHNSAITVNNVPFTVALETDTLETVLSVNPMFGLEIEMMEAY